MERIEPVESENCDRSSRFTTFRQSRRSCVSDQGTRRIEAPMPQHRPWPRDPSLCPRIRRDRRYRARGRDSCRSDGVHDVDAQREERSPAGQSAARPALDVGVNASESTRLTEDLATRAAQKDEQASARGSSPVTDGTCASAAPPAPPSDVTPPLPRQSIDPAQRGVPHAHRQRLPRHFAAGAMPWSEPMSLPIIFTW